MLGLAFMAWLTVVICYGGNWILGQCMIERPIVVGLVAGILMGDISAGCIIGASLEAIFMGAVNIGGAISAEPVTATALAVAFTVAGVEQSAAITIAVPVGVVTAFLSIAMNNILLNFFAAPFDKMAKDGNERGLCSALGPVARQVCGFCFHRVLRRVSRRRTCVSDCEPDSSECHEWPQRCRFALARRRNGTSATDAVEHPAGCVLLLGLCAVCLPWPSDDCHCHHRRDYCCCSRSARQGDFRYGA